MNPPFLEIATVLLRTIRQLEKFPEHSVTHGIDSSDPPKDAFLPQRSKDGASEAYPLRMRTHGRYSHVADAT